MAWTSWRPPSADPGQPPVVEHHGRRSPPGAPMVFQPPPGPLPSRRSGSTRRRRGQPPARACAATPPRSRRRAPRPAHPSTPRRSATPRRRRRRSSRTHGKLADERRLEPEQEGPRRRCRRPAPHRSRSPAPPGRGRRAGKPASSGTRAASPPKPADQHPRLEEPAPERRLLFARRGIARGQRLLDSPQVVGQDAHGRDVTPLRHVRSSTGVPSAPVLFYSPSVVGQWKGVV